MARRIPRAAAARVVSSLFRTVRATCIATVLCALIDGVSDDDAEEQ